MPEFRAKAPQATASEGLGKGPYVVARATLQTLQMKGVESTNAPPRPTHAYIYYNYG